MAHRVSVPVSNARERRFCKANSKSRIAWIEGRCLESLVDAHHLAYSTREGSLITSVTTSCRCYALHRIYQINLEVLLSAKRQISHLIA